MAVPNIIENDVATIGGAKSLTILRPTTATEP
jgi:hypothetical protein